MCVRVTTVIYLSEDMVVQAVGLPAGAALLGGWMVACTVVGGLIGGPSGAAFGFRVGAFTATGSVAAI